MPSAKQINCNMCRKDKPRSAYKKSKMTKKLLKTCTYCYDRIGARRKANKAAGKQPNNGKKIAAANKALERASTAELLGSNGSTAGDNECVWFLRGMAVAERCTVPELVTRLVATYRKEKR